jgi:hypothetical protein
MGPPNVLRGRFDELRRNNARQIALLASPTPIRCREVQTKE